MIEKSKKKNGNQASRTNAGDLMRICVATSHRDFCGVSKA